MEISDDDIPESDVDFSGLNRRELSKLTPRYEDIKCSRENLYACEEKQSNLVTSKEYTREIQKDKKLLAVSERKLFNKRDEEIDDRTDVQSIRNPPEKSSVSNEYSNDLTKQPPIGEVSILKKRGKKSSGKLTKRRKRNPFISFYLSMYSRRPRQRVTEVARQAGRQWGRMSNSQRKHYADL